jgi:hypothetical protein
MLDRDFGRSPKPDAGGHLPLAGQSFRDSPTAGDAGSVG